ncbi:MAG: dimethyl sulfoxide reductase anchor subunit [Gammaproteobacteria bacterium]|jgi:DMSO reductase anchor subunit
MKPALSVILLTTLIGAGQGLFLAWYSAEWLTLLRLQVAGAPSGGGLAALLSFALLGAGLLASFFHLGHPERAWRAAAMWRSSWLSREVIALPAAMALIGACALISLGGLDREIGSIGDGIPLMLSTLVGLAAAAAVCVLFVCTAMIYACLKFLRQWHSPLTVLNFFLLGSASGATLATALAALIADPRFGYFAGLAMLLTFFALLSRLASLGRNRRLRGASTLQSAIGVHHPKIRQIAQGAMGGSFNTRAFVHAYGASVVRLARRGFLLFAFLVPFALLAVAGESAAWFCVAAFLVQLAGLMAERWYFFIEAEHPQNVYYQVIS